MPREGLSFTSSHLPGFRSSENLSPRWVRQTLSIDKGVSSFKYGHVIFLTLWTPLCLDLNSDKK